MTIIVIRPMYFKGDVTSLHKIDSNGAVQNFIYCTENFFYMKKTIFRTNNFKKQQLNYFFAKIASSDRHSCQCIHAISYLIVPL